MKYKFLILLLFFAIACACFAQTNTDLYKDLLNQANQTFSKASTDPNQDDRQTEYLKAAAYYQEIIDKGDIHNPKLYYNMANAYLLAGKLGKAILNYNRALKLDKYDHNIQKNLAFARSKRVNNFEMQIKDKILKTIFFWHYDFSLKTRYMLGTIGLGLFFILMGIFIIFGKKTGLISLLVITFLFCTALLTSAFTESFLKNVQKSGVITAVKSTAYQGDGEHYPQSFTEPLNEGIEFDVLEDRGTWLYIQLPDKSKCWIKRQDVDVI